MTKIKVMTFLLGKSFGLTRVVSPLARSEKSKREASSMVSNKAKQAFRILGPIRI